MDAIKPLVVVGDAGRNRKISFVMSTNECNYFSDRTGQDRTGACVSAG